MVLSGKTEGSPRDAVEALPGPGEVKAVLDSRTAPFGKRLARCISRSRCGAKRRHNGRTPISCSSRKSWKAVVPSRCWAGGRLPGKLAHDGARIAHLPDPSVIPLGSGY